MLCISLLPGDYFTVGDDTVIQFDRLSGERMHLIIQAPKTVPILRGGVLERQGGKRPDCVMDVSPRYVRQLPWDHKKKQALAELRAALDGMGGSPEARTIREKLDVIFPQTGDSSVKGEHHGPDRSKT